MSTPLNDVADLRRTGRRQWMTQGDIEVPPDVTDRCTGDVIAAAIGYLPGVRVDSVSLNRSGSFETPPHPFGAPSYVEESLPDYCEVVVEQESPAGNVALVTVWVPLSWNKRFLGSGGHANRTTVAWIPGDELRHANLGVAIRNGFASAVTDGGYGKNPRFTDWQFDEQTGKNDPDLIENWIHRSTHDMTVIGKAVVNAIHGTDPEYSYFQGGSGGGRQAMAQVQCHSSDYDGVWASDPAINWSHLIAAELWPAVVTKELANPLSPVKLEAFRVAAVDDFNRLHGTSDPFASGDEPTVFAASRIVGWHTADGEITEANAAVMQMIWDGPHTAAGEPLWFGLRPGTESWGDNFAGVGTCTTTGRDGELVPDPFALSTAWFGSWILEDPEWDWTTLTFEGYGTVVPRGCREVRVRGHRQP